MPTLYWCPHQVLKSTGAPGQAQVITEVKKNAFLSKGASER